MDISDLEDEFRLAVGTPMLLYLKRPTPDQEPGLTAMIEGYARRARCPTGTSPGRGSWNGC